LLKVWQIGIQRRKLVDIRQWRRVCISLLEGTLTMTGPLLAMMVMTPMYTADAWALIAGIHTS
jgi:hypothetical protein